MWGGGGGGGCDRKTTSNEYGRGMINISLSIMSKKNNLLPNMRLNNNMVFF